MKSVRTLALIFVAVLGCYAQDISTTASPKLFVEATNAAACAALAQMVPFAANNCHYSILMVGYAVPAGSAIRFEISYTVSSTGQPVKTTKTVDVDATGTAAYNLQPAEDFSNVQITATLLLPAGATSQSI
ncbi:MAG TPA: hypothetical protein VKX49_04320 [Bryobacteraceae bacterium]|nr:hypothetical protein [Bryobacteraceae bacterium]